MLYKFTGLAILAAFVFAAPPAQAAFPGANGKIAFDLCPSCTLIAVNPDGSGPSDPGFDSYGWQRAVPSWSPGGTDVAFWAETFDEEPWDLVSWAGVWFTGGSPENFSWSPDGSRIALGFGGRIYVAQVGSGWTQISNGGDSDPDWRPDGSKIAFVRGGDIWTMNPDGAAQASIIATPDSEFGPSWRPDGAKLAFSRTGDVWTMNADGSGQTNLTGAGAGNQPAWSPDGRKIAFIRSFDLWTMNADGTAQTQITTYAENADGNVAHPDWQPLRALDPFPRPGGATPLRVPLVPSYQQCTSPNSQHVQPLDEPSCTPPALTSQVLTTSKIGVGQGMTRLDVILGNSATPADEADVRIIAKAFDVRCAATNSACPGGAGSDFTGKLLLSSAIRLTDRNSGFGGVSATVSDAKLQAPLDCSATANTALGSSCAATTTADSLIPGFVTEEKRSVISTFSLTLDDPGPNGTGYGPSCPPSCGDGDEAPYLTQGVFTGL